MTQQDFQFTDIEEYRYGDFMSVNLIRAMADDNFVVQAAKVSTAGYDALLAADMKTKDGLRKFINFLMVGRHGSPFEHNSFTFFVKAPIFVWREFMRHRIGISYNEESGRYKQLEPEFYVPSLSRNLKQVGKPGAYDFVPGTAAETAEVRRAHIRTAQVAYGEYESLLSLGVAREVARMSLPLNIYSSAWVTMNARSIMAFLSLRTKSENAKFPSFPQREIEIIAQMIEDEFKLAMPFTWETWDANGRVAP